MQTTHSPMRQWPTRHAILTALAIAGLGLIGWASPASAQLRFQVSGTTLQATDPSGTQAIELGCAGTQALALGRTVFIACGAEGVVRVDLPEAGAPTVQRVPIQGEVQGLFAAGGAIWARLPNGAAQQLEGPAAATPAPEGGGTPAGALAAPAGGQGASVVPPVAALPDASAGMAPMDPYAQQGLIAPRAPGQVIGRVVEERDGYAIVELNPEITMVEGAGVEFVRPADNGPLSLGGESEELVVAARGDVVAVSGSRARVRVEINGRVQQDMRVRDTGHGGGLSLMPPLPSNSFEISFMIRAFLPIDTLGFGAINELNISYLTEPGIRLGVDLAPLGFGVSNDGNPFGTMVHATIGYAMRWFEVGLGFGWSSIAAPRWSWDPSAGSSIDGGFSMQQMIRIGNEDGLSFRARSNVMVRNEAWSFGDLYMDARFPVAHGVWILLGGGGGTTGNRYGEGGARMLLSGNGGNQSLFLKITGGVGWIENGSFSYAGPMLGAGLDWRI